MLSQANITPDKYLVYVVDDDVSIANLVFHTLESRGYHCRPFYSGAAMLDALREEDPNLIILDVMMPGANGVEVARQLRQFSQVPIMMLSVRNDVSVKATALNMGADDYLTKPFEVEELLARVRAILRRSVPSRGGESPPVYQAEGLQIDLDHSLVTVGGKPVKLTSREWAVLRILVRHRGQVVTPRQLLQEAWGPQYGNESDYVRAYIARLRRKLEPDPKKPRYILLEWGLGYRLVDAR